VAKGSYPAELDVPLPFSLVSNDEAHDRLLIMPAYWWMHNMYALARNAWKFRTRDHRRTKTQKIEFDALAPDTAEEIFHAMDLLETWTGKAFHAKQTPAGGSTGCDAPAIGRQLLMADEDHVSQLEILGENIENSRRRVVVLKVRQAYRAYRDMLLYYAVKTLADYCHTRPDATLESMARELEPREEQAWVNLGGQLVPAREVQRLQADIKCGRLNSWNQIHGRYDELWAVYPLDKQRHALATLRRIRPAQQLTPALWNEALDEAIRVQGYICNQVYLTRKKDFEDPFRKITFRNAAEMRAVLGEPAENSFVLQVRAETEAFRRLMDAVRAPGRAKK
jgi:hypothetical protein